MRLKFSYTARGFNAPEARLRRNGQALKQLGCLAFLLSIASVSAAQANFEEDFDDGEKPWQEIAVQLPAPPVAANLVPFFVSATATQEFAIDAKSLTLGSDGVIRYSLVTTSTSGAKNISYEGIR